ncbi:phosphatase and actin regulator 4 isoform X4 [Marmota marmota marmota]|uniref:phosphatase and actin regulator 4 isoform X4 n=1 Tax=Marmota marmota marmota TaxID=9994 RepID=UPI002092F272|nr:phosphatase and actin regulator 4 isoform X4 [Marmota marmota marmota]
MGQADVSRPVNPDAVEEAGQPTADPGMVMDSVEAGDTTPPTKRKSKFSGFGKIFKPWKWRKKKSSDKFKETSEVLERKISMRKPREELVKRGVLLEDPEQGGEDPGKLSHAVLKNGHTTPIGSARSSSPVLVEEEPVRTASVNSLFPEEDPKKRLGSIGSQSNSEAESVSENVPKQPLLPPKRPLSSSHEASEGSAKDVTSSGSMASDNFSEDSSTLGRTRSLPITIEMLKVPDDEEEEEQTCPLEFVEDVASTSVIPKLPQCLQEEEEKESDSDSEGPVQYRDEEDEDESHQSALANKVKRKDTLAMKLNHRSSEPELNLNSWPRKSKEEWNEIRHQIGNTLIRRLSQRPTPEELEQRNILQPKNEADRQAEKREIKRRLTRKLSQRPTVAELLARKILRFNEYVEVTDAQDYDRRADKPWTKLTPADKAAIRKELNEFKSSEMEVHEESKHFTR